MAANTASSRIPTAVPTMDAAEISSQPSSTTPASSNHKVSYTELSEADYFVVCERIGAPEQYYKGEAQSKKVPDGLYKDAKTMRKHSSWHYFFIMILYNFCVILQLVLGAILTALAAVGSQTADKVGISITVLAAVNTVNAGMIALLHNSGFPQRLRSDVNEYSKVVEYLECIMHARIVPVGMSKDEVIRSAYEKYDAARATVEKNQPTYYVGQSTTTVTATATTGGTTSNALE